MKYRIVTEYGDSWDGPWHRFTEHAQVIDFPNPISKQDEAMPLMEIEGIPVRMRYEPVDATEGVEA